MPYAPGIQSVPFRADMSGWGNALMQFIGDKQKREEQVKADAKSHKTYIAMGEQLGLDAKELNNAGLEGATGMVRGFIAKQEIERGIQQFAAANQKMQQEQYAFQQQKQDAGAIAEFRRRHAESTGTLPMGGADLQVPGMERQNPAWNRGVQPNVGNLMIESGMAPDDMSKMAMAFDRLQQVNDPTKAMFAKAAVMNAENSVDEAKLSREVFARGGGNKPTVTVEDVVNGKKVRRQLTNEQFDAWQGSNPDKATQTLTAKLTELRAAKAAGKTTVDLDQLMGGGVDLSPWWGGKPIDDGIKYLETKLGGNNPLANIPQEHIDYAKKNPGKRDSFAKQYGEAAAAAVFGN